MSLHNFVKLWTVSEKELEEEIRYLREVPEYKKSLSASDDNYAKTLRKLAEATIILWRLYTFLILTLLLISGIYLAAQYVDFNWKRMMRVWVYILFSYGVFIVPIQFRIGRLKRKL